MNRHICVCLVPKPLVELHIKLLRKLGKSVTTERWEKYLAKVSTSIRTLAGEQTSVIRSRPLV